MHNLKSFGYYLIWTIYYFLCFALCSITPLIIANLKHPTFISVTLLLAIISAIISPFFAVKYLINKFYYNIEDKNRHSRRWATFIAVIVFIYTFGIIHDSIKGNLDLTGTMPIILFNGCLSISLFITKFEADTPVIYSSAKNYTVKIPDINLKPLNIKPSNKVKYIVGGVLAFLLITNPSLQAFKAHQGEVSYEGLNRKYNFFVFSIYGDGTSQYIGVLGNFIEI